jgi:hypothetical protein
MVREPDDKLRYTPANYYSWENISGFLSRDSFPIRSLGLGLQMLDGLRYICVINAEEQS